MKKNTYLLGLVFVLFIGVFFVSCDFMDDHIKNPGTTTCDKSAVEDATRFNQVSTNNYTITNVVLNGNCLEITVSSSGCNPNNWDMNFVASEVVVETLPNQWNAKVELINNEACQAVFQKTVSFDLKDFQWTGQNQVLLNIDGWNTPILYQY
ncbi:hypothetical protein NU10_12835 [Flavobacterium dauae]|uniref:hypothetical protein n=1 Tax=Flavobacterium dauae TaxID=1563479 RepID=UPI00101B47C8|nr:hypothetical protein [Flavobacterium dauae]WLD23576.1 hypothetical protein NU10_12835 [Flavobacterium dauae]